MLFISDNAKNKVEQLRTQDELGQDHFIRVSVTSGGCSGLSYKMEFDNSSREDDEVFEHNGEKLVTDRKSVLYQ